MRTLAAVPLLVLLLAACGDGFHNQPLQRAEVRGRVVGADPAQASVSVMLGDASAATPATGPVLATVGVDAEGHFVLADVPATRITLYVVGSSTQATYVTLDAPPAQVTDVGDVKLQSAASLTIVVRDGAGRPMPGAEVDVDSTPFGRQTTDTFGTVTFSPVAAACYHVRARADGFEDAELNRCVSTGEAARVDITLQAKG